MTVYFNKWNKRCECFKNNSCQIFCTILKDMYSILWNIVKTLACYAWSRLWIWQSFQRMIKVKTAFEKRKSCFQFRSFSPFRFKVTSFSFHLSCGEVIRMTSIYDTNFIARLLNDLHSSTNETIFWWQFSKCFFSNAVCVEAWKKRVWAFVKWQKTMKR